jgi:hypothetical protein
MAQQRTSAAKRGGSSLEGSELWPDNHGQLKWHCHIRETLHFRAVTFGARIPSSEIRRASPGAGQLVVD